MKKINYLAGGTVGLLMLSSPLWEVDAKGVNVEYIRLAKSSGNQITSSSQLPSNYQLVDQAVNTHILLEDSKRYYAILNGVTQGQGKMDKGLTITNDLTNSKNFAWISDSASFGMGDQFSMECWVKVTSDGSAATARNGAIFEKSNLDLKGADTGENSYMLYEASYNYEIPTKRTFRPHVYSPTRGWIYGAIDFDFALNTWYHVAYTYDAATGVMKAYINGVEYPIVFTQRGQPGDKIKITNAPIRIGYSARNYHPFNGAVDEIRIWNTVRTKEQIVANMNQKIKADQKELVGYWTFD